MDIVFDTERIRRFLEKFEDRLEQFCNFQQEKVVAHQKVHRPDLAYGNFKGNTDIQKARTIVKVCADRGETPNLIFYIIAWWLDEFHGEASVITDDGLSNELCLAAQILWGRDRFLGEDAFDYLARIVPAFKEIWKPENTTALMFDPLRDMDAFIAHLSRCELLLQQVDEHIQQHRWQDAWDSFSQLSSLQPNYGNFSWRSDQRQDFINLQKVWDAALSGFMYDENLPQGHMFPYTIFREMKKAVTPGSSMEEVQTELRKLDKKEVPESTRAALESLGKNEEERLFVDVFLYPNCPGMDVALSIEQVFLKSGYIPTPDEIKSRYPATAGELLFLMGYSEEAAEFWRAAQRESPLDGRYAHNLGLLYLGLSQSPNEMTVENWECAIAQWAISLSDTTYWISWGRERFNAYGCSFVFATISNLTSRLPDHLVRLIENAKLQGEQAEKTQKIAALQRGLLVEFTAVRLMQAVGNIPLASGRLARFGPLWMKHFGVDANARESVSQFMRDIKPADIQPNALMSGLTPEDVLQRLRWLFSELNWAASQLDNDPRSALEGLPKRAGTPSWENNPAYELLPDNSAQLEEDMLQLEFLARLRLLSKLLGQSASTTVEMFQKEWQEIADLIGRSRNKENFHMKLRKFLEDVSNPSQAGVERLNATIALLEAYLTLASVTPLLSMVAPLDETLIKNRLAGLLRLRAENRQERDDSPGAEADLKRALEYNPNDWESRALLANLWITLIIGLNDRFMALDYLRRAKALILEGQKKSPGFDFDTLLQEIEKGIKRFTSPEQRHPIFSSQREEGDQVEEGLAPLPSMDEEENLVDEESPSEMLKLYRKAVQEKLSGRLTEALRTLEEALGINPKDFDLQSVAAETVTALAARYADQKKTAEARKLIDEWLSRLPLYQERLERRKAFFNVWPKLRDWLGELPYHARDFEYLEVPIQSQKTSTLAIMARPERDDLHLSASLPIIPASDEETALSNLLQATRVSPIFKVASPRKLDFLLMGQAPIDMLDARWFLLLILELFNYADSTHPEIMKLDGLQNRFRENHQQLTQDFQTPEFLSASSRAVERFCREHSLGLFRTTEAHFEISAFSKVIMDASKDNVRFSTVLEEIDLHQHFDQLVILRKCAEFNHRLQWCKLTLNEEKKVILSLELPYVEGEITAQAFSQLEQTWHEVKDFFADESRGKA